MTISRYDMGELSRNARERATGYPSRVGTARRDEYRNLLDGEYNGQGKRMGPARGDMSAEHDWSAFDRAFASMQPKPASTQVAPPSSHEDAHAETAVNLQPPGPKMGDTRPTSTGGMESWVPTSGGGRWVGSVNNAPAPNNLAPGQANTASLANHRTVQYPQRLFNRDASGMTMATPEQIAHGSDYLSGKNGVTISETDPSGRRIDQDPAYASIDSAAVQGALNDALPGAQKAREAITANGGRPGQGMTPYGQVAVTGPQMQGPPTPAPVVAPPPAPAQPAPVAPQPGPAPLVQSQLPAPFNMPGLPSFVPPPIRQTPNPSASSPIANGVPTPTGLPAPKTPAPVAPQARSIPAPVVQPPRATPAPQPAPAKKPSMLASGAKTIGDAARNAGPFAHIYSMFPGILPGASAMGGAFSATQPNDPAWPLPVHVGKPNPVPAKPAAPAKTPTAFNAFDQVPAFKKARRPDKVQTRAWA